MISNVENDEVDMMRVEYACLNECVSIAPESEREKETTRSVSQCISQSRMFLERTVKIFKFSKLAFMLVQSAPTIIPHIREFDECVIKL